MTPDADPKKAELAQSVFKGLWRMLKESGSELMVFKLFKNQGDHKPFRAIVLVEGEEAVDDVLRIVEKRGPSGDPELLEKLRDHDL